MGKRLISQRRGKGSSTFRVPERAFKPSIYYKNMNGSVIDIVHDPLRDSPLAKVKYADNTIGYMVAPEGIRVGDSIDGYVMPLSRVNEGSEVFCVETYPNSGPKICRSPGSSAILISKGPKNCVIQLPSKMKKKIHVECRVTIGRPAGEGRKERPLIKAGNKHFMMRKRGKMYPRTSGKAMNAVDHPYGGSGHGTVRPPVGRDTPPGRKVGTVAPRRTGRRK